MFYIMGAGTTFMLGALLLMHEHSLMKCLGLEKAQTVPMLSGAIVSVFFYVSVKAALSPHPDNLVDGAFWGGNIERYV